MIERSGLQHLLTAMCLPRTFYILGAGASYGLIPLTQDMRRIIELDYHSVGVYQTTPAKHSHLFERIFGAVSVHEQDIRRILLTHMPPSALDLLAQKALWRPRSGIVPPQYAIFELVGAPATLCNFNLDGLASVHCSHRHFVLEMHGRIDSALFEKRSYSDLLEATVVYGVRFPHLTPKLMPQPEPIDIANHPIYINARRLLQMAPAVILLGYSFGQRGDRYDDMPSLDFFSRILKRDPRPVFIVSPTPDDLAEMMRDRLKSNNVSGISLRWEVFSGAVLANASLARGMNLPWVATNLKKVMRSYSMMLDAL